eukprot:scaffold2334_cov138-Skeletonema_menzelii.AAC.9
MAKTLRFMCYVTSNRQYRPNFICATNYLRGCGAVVARPLCMRKVRGSTPRISTTPKAFVSERSKELDSSSSVFALVGSNPTECITF